MMRLSTVYSNANTPLSIKNNGLVKYQSKAPVHWGVNAACVDYGRQSEPWKYLDVRLHAVVTFRPLSGMG